MASSSSKLRKRTGMNTELTLEDAVRYMKAVAGKLDGEKTADSEKTAETFFHLMKEFNEDRIDAYQVITKVYELLKGHPDLLEGFNAFLPEDVDPLTILKKQTEEDDVSLVLRVEWRFRNNVQSYRRFIAILYQYRSMQKSAEVTCQEMKTLFEGNEDLFEAFKKYLPADTPGVDDNILD
ncbi:Paired amphipathic helix protein sin3-like [Thalictrum thalictroides]|uniref:Paired amphipathic helix protein sin3-like n=1 Tax=Thalictrum thalictroides TaxID=46969 RepID=A0A7J6VB40_THATH|nr:Paired amphipathic helix protein sin3-like [Thalictrum thalictroides]